GETAVVVLFGECSCDPETEPKCDQSALRPVVDVPLETAPTELVSLDQPAARGAQLVQLDAELGGELVVSEDHPERVSDVRDQLRGIGDEVGRRPSEETDLAETFSE